MKFILLTVLALPFSSFAQSRPNIERGLQNQLRETTRLIQENIQRMDEREIREASSLLKEVSRLAEGRSRRPSPPRDRLTCINDSALRMQKAFTRIKNFAYSTSGLNYSSVGATSFAQTWVSSFSCNDADLWLDSAQRLRSIAYLTTGLNYSSAAAARFTLDNVQSFCSRFNLESEFATHRNFAYSTSGLNYSSAAAAQYALKQIERQAFSCNEFR